MICPNCMSSGCCHSFYEVVRVPTNSCLLVEDRARALDFPTGDIALAVCNACGFIFNAAWDAQRTVYSDQYEETQASRRHSIHLIVLSPKSSLIGMISGTRPCLRSV